jgi:hypothetical protein
MRIFLNKLFLGIILLSSMQVLGYRQAVVTVPVTDLVTQPLGDHCADLLQVRANYGQVSPSWVHKSAECVRVHQAIFNEVVDVLAETTYELKVAVKNCFYGDRDQIDGLWGLKEHFEYCDQIDLSGVPAPVEHTNKKIETGYQVITLRMPFYDFNTGCLYSAGTRFCCVDLASGHCAVLLNNYNTNQLNKTYIPIYFCQLGVDYLNQQSQINNFVALVRDWAAIDATNPQAIPFVWAGTTFCAKQSLINCHNIVGRSKLAQEQCYTGFDASGLVLRAAQICGLPYFYKNTTTAFVSLKALPANCLPANGDLICAPGFIAVITDVLNHKLVRAVGAGAGYGYVVETNLNEAFLNINSYQELVAKLSAGESIVCIGSKGEIRTTFNNLKICDLRCLWDK